MIDQSTALAYLQQRGNPNARLDILAGSYTPQKAAKKTRRNGKVAVVGDSLGVGTVPYLKKYTRVKANVKTGRSSEDGVNALKHMHGYDSVVLDLGTNDMNAKQLAHSIRRAKRYARGARIVVPLVHGPNAKQKNRVIRKSGVQVLNWGKAHGGDGIHSTAKGYRRRAKLLARSLR